MPPPGRAATPCREPGALPGLRRPCPEPGSPLLPDSPWLERSERPLRLAGCRTETGPDTPPAGEYARRSGRGCPPDPPGRDRSPHDGTAPDRLPRTASPTGFSEGRIPPLSPARRRPRPGFFPALPAGREQRESCAARPLYLCRSRKFRSAQRQCRRRRSRTSVR